MNTETENNKKTNVCADLRFDFRDKLKHFRNWYYKQEQQGREFEQNLYMKKNKMIEVR